MATELARQSRPPGQIATNSPTSAIDSFRFLDVYAGGLSDEAPRVEALATISAGYRSKGDGNRPGNPQRSKDGTIYLHDATGRAPGLAKALELNSSKRLTIAFPFDDPARFIHCRFMRYSASELQAFGDETHLMVLIPGKGYTRVEAGTERYAEEVKTCKVAVSVYFCLAEWGRNGPEIVFPDGVGAYYRLRFTSRHSLRSIITGLRAIGQFTQGRIAGVPFDLAIDFREVAGSDGKKRTIPVWWIATKPSGGARLSSGNFSDVINMALDQGKALMLPAPPEPTFEDALAEGPPEDLDEAIIDGVVVGDVSDREIDLVAHGGRCNADYWRSMFFSSSVRGSELDGDESPARAAWLREYTKGKRCPTESLSEFLHWATEREAQAMVVAADDAVKARIVARTTAHRDAPVRRTTPAPRGGRSYQDLFPDDDKPTEKVTPQTEQQQPEMPTAAHWKKFEENWKKGEEAALVLGADPPDRPTTTATLAELKRAQADMVEVVQNRRALNEEFELRQAEARALGGETADVNLAMATDQELHEMLGTLKEMIAAGGGAAPAEDDDGWTDD